MFTRNEERRECRNRNNLLAANGFFHRHGSRTRTMKMSVDAAFAHGTALRAAFAVSFFGFGGFFRSDSARVKASCVSPWPVRGQCARAARGRDIRRHASEPSLMTLWPGRISSTLG